MKSIIVGIVLLLSICGVLGLAQAYSQVYGVYDGGYHASTAGEGYARGLGDAVRSQGVYNLLSSQAAVNLTDAQRREIENQQQWTDTYFRMRETNREYLAKEKGPRPTKEDWIRYGQMGRPARLSPSELDTVSGVIHWPRLLTLDSFANDRAELEQLFAERAQAGGMSGEGSIKAQQATKAMLEDLKAQITQVPSSDYVRARKFIESLAYEASLPNS
jgi:SLT domain-containing protein